ncbi:origin recognition complex subunit 5 C-terminus-domain-containing protein [Hyaloraphidium curvatum]|nr:origin recognition complex subunit 5 C-terminus-domain-containing protein [Hyaloraphidium curvatum]
MLGRTPSSAVPTPRGRAVSAAPSDDDEPEAPRRSLRRPATAPATPADNEHKRQKRRAPARAASPEERGSSKPASRAPSRAASRAQSPAESEDEEPRAKGRKADADPADDADSDDEWPLEDISGLEHLLTEEELAFRRHVEQTADAFPERRNHINRLARFIGIKFENPSLPAIFVWGAASTGKTSVVRHLFSPLGKRHAYVDCAMCVAPRALFESALDQLAGVGEDADADPFARYAKCDNLADFVLLLGEVFELDKERLKECRYLIFDNAEKLRDMGPNLFTALCRLSELADRNVSCVFVSKAPFDNFRPKHGVLEPILLYFGSYPRPALRSILARMPLCEDEAERPLLRRFAELCLDVFGGACNDVAELKHVVSLLWPTYVAPVRDGELKATETHKLYTRAMLRIREVSDKLFLREISAADWHREPAAPPAAAGPARPRTDGDAVHLPRYGKYLVIAAFLASYNPQKYDRRLFLKHDNVLARKRGGGRKGGQIRETFGKDRQQLLGPKVFPVERMVAIFHSILDDPLEEVTVDLQTQIANLFSLNLLQRTTEDGVERLEGVRAKCNVSFEFVQRLAKDLQFELGKYLYNFE